jgi:hypothetical protein
VGFLEASIYAEGYINGSVESLTDLISRNQCQVSDVLSLMNQRDKVRQLIRDAFLTCDSEKIPGLRKAYTKANAEIYYVRHIVDSAVVLKIPYASLSTLQLKDEAKLYYPAEKLYQEMYSRYVGKNKFEEEEFDVFFNQLQSKYQGRKSSYVFCESSAWAEVADKWQDFVDNLGGFQETAVGLKAVVGRAEKIIEAVTDTTYKGYFDGLVTLNLNNESPAPAFGDIVAELEENLPSSGVITQESLLYAVQGANVSFDVKQLEASMGSNFEMLYKNTSDETVKIFIEELDNMNQAIVDSYGPQSEILNCTRKINSRQCPSAE